ncbi:MAG: helix-turn-helix domain-containing protein [Micromonosporaceae bacterium]|nr:helix-turn-helix domain-containing protein [Micromonosporaceae bacterium]
MADTPRPPTTATAQPPVPTETVRENRALRDLVAVYRQLSGLALQDADLGSVARLIADHLAATVAVVNPKMDVLAAAAPGETPEKAEEYIRENVVHPRLAQVLAASGQNRRVLRLPDVRSGTSVVVAPILVGDNVPAFLMTLDRGELAADRDRTPGEDMSLLLTEHAATICGVILGRERVVAAAASRVRGDLVEGLLFSRDPVETARWAKHLGYDEYTDHRVLSVVVQLVAPGDPATEARTAVVVRTAAAVERFFASRAPGAITSVRDEEVVVVLPETGPVAGSTHPAGEKRRGGTRAAALGAACVKRIEETFNAAEIVMGVGGVCRRPVDIGRSYAEARRTMDAMRRVGRRGVVLFDELGIYRLLLQIPDLAELHKFVAEVLGRLTSYEREHGSKYLSTLACYLQENNSPQRAARKLHVHPNTVTYRIRRVEEISGLDLDNYRDRLMAQVALEILGALGLDALGLDGLDADALGDPS